MITTGQLRASMTALLRDAMPPETGIFFENKPVRGPALNRGYIRVALSIQADERLLGADQPVSGQADFTVAVPWGGGMKDGDDLLARLTEALSYQSHDGMRFGGLEVAAGRQAGQLWLTDATINLIIWQQEGPSA
jgi:hypothetical protein